MKNGYRLIGLYLLALLGLLCVMCSCKHTEYVPIRETHTEIKNIHDTIRQVDSVWNEVSTVIREVDSTELAALGIKIKNLQQEKAWLIERDNQKKEKSQGEKITSIEYIKGDSIPVPYPVKEPLSRWQQFACDYGKIMIGATIAAVIAVTAIIILWIRRRRPG